MRYVTKAHKRGGPKYGYSNVTDTAFVDFAKDLDQGGWASVVVPPGLLSAPDFVTSLMGVPLPVVLKARLLTDIDFLSRCLLVGASEADQADNDWDTTERLLNLDLAQKELSSDLSHRAAAQRLRTSLMKGGTTAQTRYSLDDEVDFGRYQIELSRKPDVAADIELLELEGRMAEVGERTEKLAAVIGRDARQGRRRPRSVLVRQATSACVGSFNAANDQLDWLLAHLPEDGDRKPIETLLAPLQALLARHPKAPVEEPPSPSGEPTPNP